MPAGGETARRSIGLRDVVRHALQRQGPTWARLVDRLTADPAVPADFHSSVRDDPIGRMFASKLGQQAVDVVRNEGKTLQIIGDLTIDLLAEAASAEVRGILPTFRIGDKRVLFMPGWESLPPTLLVLDPRMEVGRTEVVTRSFPVFPQTADIAGAGGESLSPEAREVRSFFLREPSALATAFAIAQPEVVVVREPRMELLSIPAPLLEVGKGGQSSTAGLYCRDSEGRLGVTACYHGTGPAGTAVTLGGIAANVAAADPQQDIVFIPLPAGAQPPPSGSPANVMSGESPPPHSIAHFEGATSGRVSTHVIAQDLGLLRNRPGVQQRLQTDPDANKGDSGCALVNDRGLVLGFAYQTTAYDDYPQFSDWIWASNALDSLGLRPG